MYSIYGKPKPLYVRKNVAPITADDVAYVYEDADVFAPAFA